MSQPTQIIGLGELLWDCFPDKRRPGGAPANVAFHSQQLGLTAAVATRVGKDEFGDEICEFLLSQGLNTDLIQRDPKRPTGTVTVSPNSLSEMEYRFLENSAWDYLELPLRLLNAIGESQATCFGTLAQRRPISRRTIRKALRAPPSGVCIVYDVNLRPPFFEKEWIVDSLNVATIIKLNSHELNILSIILNFPASDEVRFAKWLLDTHRKLELVCITRGANGCLAVACDQTVELPGIPIEVVDTVGAGDAFTAGMMYGYLEKWPLAKTIELANRFGSLVASRSGAMPVLTQELESLKAELELAFRE